MKYYDEVIKQNNAIAEPVVFWQTDNRDEEEEDNSRYEMQFANTDYDNTDQLETNAGKTFLYQLFGLRVQKYGSLATWKEGGLHPFNLRKRQVWFTNAACN